MKAVMGNTAERVKDYEDFWPADKVRLLRTFVDDDGATWALLMFDFVSAHQGVRSVVYSDGGSHVELRFRKGSAHNKTIEDGELAPEYEEDWAEHHPRWMQSPERKKLYDTVATDMQSIYAVRLPHAPGKDIKIMDHVMAGDGVAHGR